MANSSGSPMGSSGDVDAYKWCEDETRQLDALRSEIERERRALAHYQTERERCEAEIGKSKVDIDDISKEIEDLEVALENLDYDDKAFKAHETRLEVVVMQTQAEILSGATKMIPSEEEFNQLVVSMRDYLSELTAQETKLVTETQALDKKKDSSVKELDAAKRELLEECEALAGERSVVNDLQTDLAVFDQKIASGSENLLKTKSASDELQKEIELASQDTQEDKHKKMKLESLDEKIGEKKTKFEDVLKEEKLILDELERLKKALAEANEFRREANVRKEMVQARFNAVDETIRETEEKIEHEAKFFRMVKNGENDGVEVDEIVKNHPMAERINNLRAMYNCVDKKEDMLRRIEDETVENRKKVNQLQEELLAIKKGYFTKREEQDALEEEMNDFKAKLVEQKEKQGDDVDTTQHMNLMKELEMELANVEKNKESFLLNIKTCIENIDRLSKKKEEMAQEAKERERAIVRSKEFALRESNKAEASRKQLRGQEKEVDQASLRASKPHESSELPNINDQNSPMAVNTHDNQKTASSCSLHLFSSPEHLEEDPRVQASSLNSSPIEQPEKPKKDTQGKKVSAQTSSTLPKPFTWSTDEDESMEEKTDGAKSGTGQCASARKEPVAESHEGKKGQSKRAVRFTGAKNQKGGQKASKGRKPELVTEESKVKKRTTPRRGAAKKSLYCQGDNSELFSTDEEQPLKQGSKKIGSKRQTVYSTGKKPEPPAKKATRAKSNSKPTAVDIYDMFSDDE